MILFIKFQSTTKNWLILLLSFHCTFISFNSSIKWKYMKNNIVGSFLKLIFLCRNNNMTHNFLINMKMSWLRVFWLITSIGKVAGEGWRYYYYYYEKCQVSDSMEILILLCGATTISPPQEHYEYLLSAAPASHITLIRYRESFLSALCTPLTLFYSLCTLNTFWRFLMSLNVIIIAIIIIWNGTLHSIT